MRILSRVHIAETLIPEISVVAVWPRLTQKETQFIQVIVTES